MSAQTRSESCALGGQADNVGMYCECSYEQVSYLFVCCFSLVRQYGDVGREKRVVIYGGFC